MKKKKILIASLVCTAILGTASCGNQIGETKTITETKTEIQNRYLNPPVLFYTHSADYSTYYVDWLEQGTSGWTVKTNQISISSSSGLKSVQTYGNYIVLLDSSSVGRLLVFDRTTLAQSAALTVGGAYPTEMVIHGTSAYVSINGDFVTQGNAVKVVDLTNPLSPSVTATLTTGNKPATLRKINGKLYLANQDSITKAQATVQSVDPYSANAVSVAINVGENPSDMGYDGSRIWTYNSKWFGGTAASLTHITGTTPTNITTFATTYKPAFGGSIAFNNSGGFVLLSPNPAAFPTVFHLFAIAGTSVNGTAVDATNQYQFVGAGETYFFKVHNGNGASQTLSLSVETLTGSPVTTQTLTKDSDMGYWPAQ